MNIFWFIEVGNASALTYIMKHVASCGRNFSTSLCLQTEIVQRANHGWCVTTRCNRLRDYGRHATDSAQYLSYPVLSDDDELKLNSVDWVRERTIPTERPPLVGEVSANFCWLMVLHGQRDGSVRQYSRLSRPEPLLFLSSSPSIVLTRLSGPRSRLTTSQEIW
jgi:hypothetical protein